MYIVLKMWREDDTHFIVLVCDRYFEDAPPKVIRIPKEEVVYQESLMGDALAVIVNYEVALKLGFVGDAGIA